MDGVRRPDAADSDELHDAEKSKRDSGDGEVVDPRDYPGSLPILTAMQPDLVALGKIRAIMETLEACHHDSVVLVLAHDVGCKLVPLEDTDFGF